MIKYKYVKGKANKQDIDLNYYTPKEKQQLVAKEYLLED
jgi:hypothetical protein